MAGVCALGDFFPGGRDEGTKLTMMLRLLGAMDKLGMTRPGIIDQRRMASRSATIGLI